MKFFFGLLVASLWAVSLGKGKSTCTETCDATYPEGYPVTFCGTDLITHVTSYEAAEGEDCYHDECQVMTYYYGPCGCPNECFTSFGYGVCDGGVCSCNSGWTGKDCSRPTSENACSLHGHVVLPGDKDSQLPYSYCSCDNGFTGIDCSSPVFSQGHVPWGTVFPGKEYTSKDKYEDDHPVWNASLIATIHVKIDEELYVDMLQPWNEANDTYRPAAFYFDNGYVRESFAEVGIRLKGQGCRSHPKRCFALKFNEFVSGQDFKGIKKLGFKSGDNDDDILAKEMLYVDMMRATGAPTQRTSYALFYVNEVFMGLYFIHEDNGVEYVDSRLPDDDGSGNYYKFGGGVHMQYLGPDVATYQNNSNYEQKSGDGDWSDLVDFFYYLNTSSDSEFEKTIEDHMNTDQLLRNMIVESFMLGTDGMTRNGRNFNLYHLRDNDHPERWTVMDYDFDISFEWKLETGLPYIGVAWLDVFGFFIKSPTDPKYNPLVNRLLAIPHYNETYLRMYSQFTEALFGSKSPKQPAVLHGERMQFILPWVQKDKMFYLSSGMTAEDFVRTAEYTCQKLNERYVNITMQINSYGLQELVNV
jgi:spore coat protein CotH